MGRYAPRPQKRATWPIAYRLWPTRGSKHQAPNYLYYEYCGENAAICSLGPVQELIGLIQFSFVHVRRRSCAGGDHDVCAKHAARAHRN